MGLFKQMKDMKDMVSAAPGMIQQSQEMAANAQAMQSAYAQQAAMAAQMPGAATAAVNPAALTPINGVDLPTYAWISKQVANAGYDQALAPTFAAQKGVGASDWEAASGGWTARMNTEPGLGAEFRRHYDVA